MSAHVKCVPNSMHVDTYFQPFVLYGIGAKTISPLPFFIQEAQKVISLSFFFMLTLDQKILTLNVYYCSLIQTKC